MAGPDYNTTDLYQTKVIWSWDHGWCTWFKHIL